MRIINIDELRHARFIIMAAILVFFGCQAKDASLNKAKDYYRKSKAYKEQAISQYESAVSRPGPHAQLYLELGNIYYASGEFEKAVEAYNKSTLNEAKKMLAISYFRDAKFTDALSVFSKYKLKGDDEYFYYNGLTCERLNLFDDALKAYGKIRGVKFSSLAKARAEAIEKNRTGALIKDVDPLTAEIIYGCPPAEKYPQAGAIILKCDERIEVTPDWKEVSTLNYVIKILNERGKDDFSEVQISYDSTYEKVEIEYARTITPEGQVVDVGARHIRDVSRYLNFPLYSNARVCIISFPEISDGAFIEYKARVYRSQLINKKDLAMSYPVQSSEPIINAYFEVSLPKEKPLKLKNINTGYNDFKARLEPRVKEAGERIIYSWDFDKLPQIMPESNMPADVEINPTILMTTFSGWFEIYKWWQDLTEDKIKADPQIKNKVRELVSGKSSGEEKARAIYNFCAKEIRYVGVEYGQAGYEPHRAEDIFKNKYGDCKDQAILFVTMLREAGLASWPVLISTEDYYNLRDDFPATLFNHCIASVLLDGKLCFLDPTAETCSFGDLRTDDQGRRVLIFKESGYEITDTPLYPPEHNKTRQVTAITVNKDESIDAEKSIFTYGLYDQNQRSWLLYTPPELIEQALKEKIQGISISGRLKHYKVENLSDLNKPVELDYSFSGSEYFTNAGDLRIMPQLTGIDTTVVAKEKRRYPIYFGAPDYRETEFEIGIPSGFVIKYIPKNVREDNLWFLFEVEYIFKGGRLFFREKTIGKKSRIFVEEYSEFKRTFESLAKRLKQRVVFEKRY